MFRSCKPKCHFDTVTITDNETHTLNSQHPSYSLVTSRTVQIVAHVYQTEQTIYHLFLSMSYYVFFLRNCWNPFLWQSNTWSQTDQVTWHFSLNYVLYLKTVQWILLHICSLIKVSRVHMSRSGFLFTLSTVQIKNAYPKEIHPRKYKTSVKKPLELKPITTLLLPTLHFQLSQFSVQITTLCFNK